MRTSTDSIHDVSLDSDVTVPTMFHKVEADSTTGFAAGMVVRHTHVLKFEGMSLNSSFDTSSRGVYDHGE